MSKWVEVSEADEEFREGLNKFLLAAVVGVGGGVILGLIIWAVAQ